jgi:hypothetical protein
VSIQSQNLSPYSLQNRSILLLLIWFKSEIVRYALPFYRNRAKAHLGLSSKVRGCNISFWRDDFANQRYNEEFTGWE